MGINNQESKDRENESNKGASRGEGELGIDKECSKN